jgi:hypothetical protein
MNFIQNCTNNFVEAAESVEYSWSDPKSLIVLVPIFSLIVQEINIGSIKSKITAERLEIPGKTFGKEDAQRMVERKGPLADVYKWHGIGAAVHIFVLALFAQFCPLLLIPLIAIGIYQAWTCFMGANSISIVIDGGQKTIKRDS